MESDNRYFRQHQLADLIIRDILPVGTEVGIVVFSDSDRVLASMRVITSPADRQALAQGLPVKSNYGGGTAIGQGLLGAIELLEANSKSTEDGQVLLITDGKENVQPLILDVLANVTSKQVAVHTLAIGTEADPNLENVSSVTGGQFLFDDESSTSTTMEAVGESLFKAISMCEDNNVIEIDRYAVLLTSVQRNFTKRIWMDSSVGNKTLFAFILSPNARTEVTIENPSGTTYNSFSLEYSKDESLNIIRFTIDLAKNGTWKCHLIRRSNVDESVKGVVRSYSRVGSVPVEVETWTSSKLYDYAQGRGVVVYTHVHQGYSPIIRAKVEVTGSKVGVPLILLDNGILPDNTRDDGVYSNSRYSLEVKVESVEGQTAVVRAGSQSGRTLSVFQNVTPPVVLEPVELFSRASSPGAIEVSGHDPTVDQFNPGRVTDLDIVMQDAGLRTLALTWTAPGDDLNEGTVAKYEVRVAETFLSLRDNFTQALLFSSEDVVKGSIDPVPAGSIQNVTLRLPSIWSSDFFVIGLIALDEANRQSDLSNFCSTTFKPITVPQRPAASDKTNKPTVWVIWVDVGLGVAVAIAVAIVVTVVCINKRAKGDNPA
ncbi:calcium-activated chloride channel regulator 4A-like [Haliotis rufescens]|uniref:calcium-activated chloride channel regulator 4A-like n=1 Tax=Haliotis rufescens TaxID=6454 RepID=UPI00201E83D2|nr:calcium-activated chloride channel regulator 4A-like [Haliotis rufescens]